MNYVVIIEDLKFIVTSKSISNFNQSKFKKIQPEESKLLNFYLSQAIDKKENVKSYTDFEISNQIKSPEGNIKQYRAKIVNAFRTVGELSKDEYPTALFFGSKIKGKTHLKHQVLITDELKNKETAIKKTEDEARSNDKVHHIINALLDTFPEHKTSIFRTDGKHILPFVGLTEDCSLPFTFPLNIDNKKSEFFPIEGLDSLYEIRKDSGASIYPGRILQLKNTNNGEYELSFTLYNELLDSSDLMCHVLKKNWTVLGETNLSNEDRKNELKNIDSEIGKTASLWNKRIDLVKNGDFSSYLAGLAFSLPMFQIHESGDLSLVFGEGSTLKASGAGQKHIIPAGMLEVFSEIIPRQFTINDFISVSSKELLEETLFGSKFKLKPNSVFTNYVASFSTEVAGQLSETYNRINASVEDILEVWNSLWNEFEGWNRESPPSTEAINQIRNFNMQNPPWFFIVDALSFRPEIIKPIYLRENLDLFLNWEYKDNYCSPETIRWSNQDELELWIEQTSTQFCAPGLASAYLGAKYYFQNKDKFSKNI